MKTLSAEYSITDLCAALEVSRSGYYAWVGREPGTRAQANEELDAQIQVIFAGSRESYGSPRVTAALRQSGCLCNHKRVARRMREQGLKGRTRRRTR